MVDVVLRQQAVGRELGFECRRAEATVGQQFVLIRVDEIRIGVVAEMTADPPEQLRPAG